MPAHHRVTTPEAARALADLLNGNTRTRPVVVVTTPHGQPVPWIDIDEIVEQVGDIADIYLVPTGPHSWELSNNLPAMTQVYGGAGRVYPVGHQWASAPRRSPLRFAYNAAEGPGATTALIDDALRMATDAGLFDSKVSNQRRQLTGVVAGIVADRAMVKLGCELGIVPDALAFPGVPLERCIWSGQELTGLYDAASRWFDVRESHLPPDVALSSYAPGDVVLVQVESVESDEAFVFLHPLVVVRLSREVVTSNPVDDMTDLLSAGEVLTARVAATGPEWRLSVLDIDDDEEPVVACALFRGGPPWLMPREDVPVAEEPVPVAPSPVEVLTFDAFDDTDVVDLAKKLAPPADTPVVRPSPVMLDRKRGPMPASPPPEAAALAASVESVSTRSMSLTIASLQAEVKQLKRQRDDVRDQAQGLATELTHIRPELHQAEDRARRLAQQLEQSRAKLRRSRSTRAAPDAVQFADRERGFRFLVELAWATRIPSAEQPSCPLPGYGIGPAFLDSVAALQGLTVDRVADVVMEVLTGKARESSGREVHQLRSGESGGAPQLVRSDGARAWRVSLQRNTPSARRLHYWVLTDGSIELAKVGVHDDMSL